MNNNLPPEPVRIIRKSAYGRTQLFLPSKGTVVREVKCMGGVVKYDQANVYHVLPELYTRSVNCWHCCEKVEKCTPIPRFYDVNEGVFYVYGATCSPNCAKAYIIEHTSFDRGQTLNVLTRMLHDVYDIHTPIIATPPRASLVRFGGFVDATQKVCAEITIVEPPFVSYCMLAQEHAANEEDTQFFVCPTVNNVEEADTFEEPPPPGLYHDFVNQQKQQATLTGSEHHTTKRSRDSQTQQNIKENKGPMAKFVKK